MERARKNDSTARLKPQSKVAGTLRQSHSLAIALIANPVVFHLGSSNLPAAPPEVRRGFML